MTVADDNPPESIPPPSARGSFIPPPPPPPSFVETWSRRNVAFVEHMGDIASLTMGAFRSIVKRPLEVSSTIYQIDSLGVRSLGIVAVTSIFIGMVMTIQFAFGLQRFGGIEYIPRVIVLSFLRELGPTLTAIIVGGRIGSGMAAEVGAMNVTEQVDAIRALGGDPAKKLVLPRVAAAMIVMPLLSVFADVLGTLGALAVCALEYDIRPRLFMQSALETVLLSDLFSGLLKTPIFGFIIAIVGCHFGLTTRGGTEGVGQSTTRTVVVVSIAILVADFFLTRIFVAILPG
ncbi:MAG: ABC transporter permease [Polyangiaceae bacterium]|jgi:phospholipid/cholesterol/gamma-HCH transport system permease protein